MGSKKQEEIMKITIPKILFLVLHLLLGKRKVGKEKEGQDSFIDSWYKMNILFGIMGMAQP